MNTIIDHAYNAFCEERFALPADRQLQELEERIGVSLPKDYRDYILEYNGGFFNEPHIVPPSDDCPLDRLTFMNGIGATHSVAELATDGDLAIFDDNDPPQVVPIGYTLMGNLIFLVTHPDDRGTIALKKAWSESSYFLAEGIEEFFSLLREPDDDR